MKLNKILKGFELFALGISLSAVIVLVFFLIRSPFKCIIPFEPNPFIRIPEIIIGIITIPFMIKLIIKRMISKR